MAKKAVTRRELLDRWRRIEEQEDIDDGDGAPFNPSSSTSRSRRPLHVLKEQWFADAFNFLICLPEESHIWCTFWDIMGPLLETFYNYFKDERPESPLRSLWKRISSEMQNCIQCISQHYQAQEMYHMEYETSSIGPLLDVLQRLDVERVYSHLKDINSRIAKENRSYTNDNAEVVSLLYEVLMYPALLADHTLFMEFEFFVEAIDNSHELALDGHQQFPGVYALFFFKRRTRSIGYRLASSMGKFRRATDLERLQPLLKKFIGFLEAEALPFVLETSIPKPEMDRVSLWIGIKSLLGFLEPPAFEEGILERYPIFLDIVLNHISGDSLEFSHVVTCLKLLFEILGCKLWLRSTLSPSVMCNTLLGQCFHSRNEKTHKDIFDLFQPFLQSLEALQDGEHAKQRRHFLYFLLHQVPMSSNFSVLTRKLACQVALLIVHRGYKMIPPCPPFECAHMWGPSLVSSLKDYSLHSSLRQPAFDLIQTIIVSDTTALVSSVLNQHPSLSIDSSMVINVDDDEDDDTLKFLSDSAEKDGCTWTEFGLQSKITFSELKEWMCIPMLWVDVLLEVDFSLLPVSFSKAVFWARSRFPFIEPEDSAEMAIPTRNWLSSHATDITHSFGWKSPSGYDDGGEGKPSTNSVDVLTMSLPLLRTFKRLTAHFLVQMRLQKHWTWEPPIGESLVLSLIDPNDTIRQLGKSILEQVSETRGLSCGLKFLCSCPFSISAVFWGLRHAMKLVQLDSVLSKFQTLHHFLFVLFKLLKQGDCPTPELLVNTSGGSTLTKSSSEGGFLRQPTFESSPMETVQFSSDTNLKSQEKFIYLLCEITWPFLCRCLVEGKKYIDYSFCQMTCVRLLEILPIIFEILSSSHGKESDCKIDFFSDLSWLHNLVHWGRSCLKVVMVYWKRTVTSLLDLLKRLCNEAAALVIVRIENLILSEGPSIEELSNQVSDLSVLLSRERSGSVKDSRNSKSLLFGSLSFDKKFISSDVGASSLKSSEMQMDMGVMMRGLDTSSIIVLSDDEMEPTVPSTKVTLTGAETSQSPLVEKTSSLGVGDKTLSDLHKQNIVSLANTSKEFFEPFPDIDAGDSYRSASENPITDNERDKEVSIAYSKVNSGKTSNFELTSKVNDKIDSDKFPVQSGSCKTLSQAGESFPPHTRRSRLNEIVQDAEDSALDCALDSVGSHQSQVVKPPTVFKRQVIQLKTPVGNRSGHYNRLESSKRFKSPRLDDWYKSILQINYFVTVGLSTGKEDNNERLSASKLKEIPVHFQSPEQYIKIFQPLVLEEFKAQLESSFLEMSSIREMFFGILSVIAVERVDDFHLVRFVHDCTDAIESRSFSENDLVLVTKDPPQKSSQDIHIVGKVERRERDCKRNLSILVVRFYLQTGSPRMHQARRNLIERSKWHVCRIMSITPQLREFQALSSINTIPILPVILNPSGDSLHYNRSREDNLSMFSQPLQQTLMSSFNDSQLLAISRSIVDRKDFELSLIQGPPGTGKTRTIVAIVSCLLAFPSQRIDGAKLSSLDSKKETSSNRRSHVSESAAIARAWQDAALAKQMHEDVQSMARISENTMRRRVLICAQSNAAVDELVARISSQGLYCSNGKMYKPYLVRVGNAKTVHQNSLPFFIDTLVDQRVAEEALDLSKGKNSTSVESSTNLRLSLEKLVDRIRFLESKRANLRDGNLIVRTFSDCNFHKSNEEKEMSDSEIESQLKKLYEQKHQIYTDLRTSQAQERKVNEEIKSLRHKLRKTILREAEVVVATLSGCGGDLYGVCSESVANFKFGSPHEHTLFDAVVIDEAAQALEPATLIPLQLLKSRGTKCIMVGDPKQLPATVLSNIASKFLYQCSMFERLQRAGHSITMLNEQYRMHPEISKFPSLHFYDNKLLNGCKISSKSAPFHETKGLGPYVFYDIIDGRELRGKDSGAFSLYNEHEADAAVEVLRFLKKRYPTEFVSRRIGIITPYKCQLSLLRSRISSVFGSSHTAEMEFNTVDGFQGREVDILLLSTVRASHSKSVETGFSSTGVGFVADVRRMNVALTRAKLSLWILGKSRTLQTNHNWDALIKDAKARNLVLSATKPYNSMFKTGFQQGCFSENCDEQLAAVKPVDKVNYTTRHVVNEGGAFGRMKKLRADDPLSSKDVPTGQKNTLASQDKHDHNHERSSNHLIISKKEHSLPFTNRDEGQSTISCEHATEVEWKIREGKSSGPTCSSPGKGRFKSEHMAKNLQNSKQPTDAKPKRTKQLISDAPKKSAEGDASLERVSIPSIQDKCKKLQTGITEDAITKRKRQREAVDAILSSSLLSSKKSDTSSKGYSRRPSSTKRGSMKPYEKRNG